MNSFGKVIWFDWICNRFLSVCVANILAMKIVVFDAMQMVQRKKETNRKKNRAEKKFILPLISQYHLFVNGWKNPIKENFNWDVQGHGERIQEGFVGVLGLSSSFHLNWHMICAHTIRRVDNLCILFCYFDEPKRIFVQISSGSHLLDSPKLKLVKR